MPRPLRIVHVLPDLRIGGAEVFVPWLVTALRDAGHESWLFTVRDRGQLTGTLDCPTWSARRTKRAELSVLTRMAWQLRKVNADVVNTHMFTAMAWGSVAARMARVPVVTFTQHTELDVSERIAQLATAGIAELIDVHMGCGEAATAYLRASLNTRRNHIVTLDNGLPLAGRPVSAVAGEPLKLGCVGRMEAVKGQRYLLEALALLRDRGTTLTLELMGDGSLRQDLEQRTERLGLRDQVTFAGMVRDVPQRLAGCDVFVQPSLSEAMPVAIMEAAAAGLPLVVTEAGGGPDVLRAGAGGRVVPPGDAVALADALGELAALPRAELQALGQASRETAMARYDIAQVAARYVEVYREALARKGR